MQIKVIFPPRNMPETGDLDDQVREFMYQSPANKVESALGLAWREFNTVNEDDPHVARKCRSMSIGDVAVAYDVLGERWFIVDTIGFKEVSADKAGEWMKLSIRDRFMGPKAMGF